MSVEDILKKDITLDPRLRTVEIPDLLPKKRTLATQVEGKDISNSLQCCCAGIFNIELDMVPNFINHPIDGYMMIFNCWIASKGLNMWKVDLTEELEFQQGQIVSNIGASFITGGSICILQSKNEFMIGQVDESSKRVKVIMDPNPPATSRNKPPYCAFFIYRSTTNYNKYYFSDQVGGYVGDDDLHQYSLRNC